MNDDDYSLVNAVALLNIACANLDWRTVSAVIDEARDNGATVEARRIPDGVNLRIARGRVTAADTVSGLTPSDASTILASLSYAGAEVKS